MLSIDFHHSTFVCTSTISYRIHESSCKNTQRRLYIHKWKCYRIFIFESNSSTMLRRYVESIDELSFVANVSIQTSINRSVIRPTIASWHCRSVFDMINRSEILIVSMLSMSASRANDLRTNNGYKYDKWHIVLRTKTNALNDSSSYVTIWSVERWHLQIVPIRKYI